MKLDPISQIYLGCVILCGIVYTAFGLTPSSYGVVLAQIGAPEQGPIFGAAQSIRADEWAQGTPYLQSSVRNGFRRVNESSFYNEDMRGASLVRDWSVIFRPEMWAFFVVPPAIAFSFYYALLMCGFLVGYFLLFRQMQIDAFVAASVAIILYFSGFVQFFWTSFGCLAAGLPWILIIVFAPWRWWLKALLLSWAMPVVLFSNLYPTILAAFVFAGIVLAAAVRPSLFRSPGEVAAVTLGGLVTIAAFYLYYRDLIPIMQATWYPGKRITPPGIMPITVALSQIFPFLSFTLRGYRSLAGSNICEIGAVGSFLPLLTFCLMSPQFPRAERGLRNGLIVLGAAIALITLWQLTPAPLWIGRLLLWNRGDPQRLLFVSGFLITVACLLIWRQNLLQPDASRIALFVVAGPLFSLLLKMTSFHLTFSDLIVDFVLCGIGLAAGVIACLIPTAQRLPLLLGSIVLMNVLAFGRFNPIQPAEPIFQVPETDLVLQLRQAEASTPGKILLEPRFFGATLNGMGFRSVNHALPSPRLDVFRKYFPAMDAKQFDFTFNRYAYIQLTNDPLPKVQNTIFVEVPMQAFEPARNLRSVAAEVSPHKDCTVQRGGAIERVSVEDAGLVIEGWAPWKGEAAEQTLHLTSARALRPGALVTVRRPDIAESMNDYAYARSGFRLELSSADGLPLQPEEVVLMARGTSQGLAQLPGCGCR